MEKIQQEKIEKLKKQLIKQYVMVTCCALILFSIVYTFLIWIPVMAGYLTGGLLILFFTYTLIREKYSADQFIHGYMILAPIYNFYIMLTFWNSSIASFITMFPMPLAAYVFFTKRKAMLYFIHMVIVILACFLVITFFHIQPEKYLHSKIIFADILTFGYTFIILILIFIYHDKVNKIKSLNNTPVKSESTGLAYKKPSSLNKATEKENVVNTEAADDLFEKLNNLMLGEKLFKNPKLNISMLSIRLDVSYVYLSKVIRYKGYQNFNNYLNVYRINYAKKLISENDLQKITLMYIYSEAGFSNQTTFNRVFKQIEGITPSEYITKITPDNRSNMT